MNTKLLIKGNAKLGPDILTWSIDHASCLGKTAVCDKVCYVKDYMKRYNAVESAYKVRAIRSMEADFVPRVQLEIIKSGCSLVRIHVCGDFYSLQYLQKWIDIATALPNVRFNCFTRVWILPQFEAKLAEFGALSNVSLSLSLDSDNVKIPVPEALKGVRKAYLSLNDSDLPPSDAFICFRNDRKQVLYKLNGVRICPHEYGTARKYLNVKCSKCLKCYK